MVNLSFDYLAPPLNLALLTKLCPWILLIFDQLIRDIKLDPIIISIKCLLTMQVTTLSNNWYVGSKSKLIKNILNAVFVITIFSG